MCKVLYVRNKQNLYPYLTFFPLKNFGLQLASQRGLQSTVFVVLLHTLDQKLLVLASQWSWGPEIDKNADCVVWTIEIVIDKTCCRFSNSRLYWYKHKHPPNL